MQVSEGIPVHELNLARLVCSKLAGILKGTTSVGITVCLGGIGDPQYFLSKQHEALRSHLVVLHCIGLKLGVDSRLLGELRKPVERLLELEGRYYESFLVLARWKTTPAAEVSQAANELVSLYEEMYRLLQAFSRSLGMQSLLESIGLQLSFEQGEGFARVMVDQFLKEITRS